MKKQYLECGKIINTHGVKGDVKLESYCDTPRVLSSLKRVFIPKGTKMVEHKVTRGSVFREFVIMHLDDVNDMDAAMLLRNTVVYADRGDFSLRKGDYFIEDIIGLDVVDVATGKKYGTLSEVINRGASDIYVISTLDGEKMIPAVAEFVKKVDPDAGIFVSPIEGMFD